MRRYDKGEKGRVGQTALLDVLVYQVIECEEVHLLGETFPVIDELSDDMWNLLPNLFQFFGLQLLP